MPPQRLGRYEILGRLAAGGMAEVLLGRMRGPLGFERPVAIKRILPHLWIGRRHGACATRGGARRSGQRRVSDRILRRAGSRRQALLRDHPERRAVQPTESVEPDREPPAHSQKLVHLLGRRRATYRWHRLVLHRRRRQLDLGLGARYGVEDASGVRCGSERAGPPVLPQHTRAAAGAMMRAPRRCVV